MTEIFLPGTYTRHQIPAKPEQIPKPESARAWPHLEKIAGKLMPYCDDVEVGVLIGTSCIRAIKPCEIITRRNDDPYGKLTALGWGIVGAVQPGENEDCLENQAIVNRVLSKEVLIGEDRKVCHLVFKVQAKEILSPSQVSKMFKMDFSGEEKEQSLSYEDRYSSRKLSRGYISVLMVITKCPCHSRTITNSFLTTRNKRCSFSQNYVNV